MKKLSLLLIPILLGVGILTVSADTLLISPTMTPLQQGMACRLAKWAVNYHNAIPLDIYQQYLSDPTLSCQDVSILSTDSGTTMISSVDSLGRPIVVNSDGSVRVGTGITITGSGVISASTQSVTVNFSFWINGELVDTTRRADAVSAGIYDGTISYSPLLGTDLGIKNLNSRLIGMERGQKRVIEITNADLETPQLLTGETGAVEIELVDFQ